MSKFAPEIKFALIERSFVFALLAWLSWVTIALPALCKRQNSEPCIERQSMRMKNSPCDKGSVPLIAAYDTAGSGKPDIASPLSGDGQVHLTQAAQTSDQIEIKFVISKPCSLIGFIDISAESFDVQDLRSLLRKSMSRLRELEIAQPLDCAETLDSFKNTQSQVACVMTSPRSLSGIRKLGVSEKQLNALAKRSKPIVLKVADKEVLFCIGEDPDRQRRLLVSILRSGKWPRPVSI